MISLTNKFRAKLALPFYFGFVLPILRHLPLRSTVFGPVKGVHRQLSAWNAICRVYSPLTSLEDGNWYYEHHPQSVVQVPMPVLGVPAVPKGFSSHSIYESPAIGFACIQNARIATKNLEVISPDDKIFGDLFHSTDDSVLALSQIYPYLPRLKKMPGFYTTITSNRNPNGYYHWIIDYLTRLWPLEESGIRDYKLVVPAKLNSFQKQSLHILGYSEDRIVPFGHEHWRVDHLLVPSLAPAYRFSPEACRWLQQRIFTAVGKAPAQSPKRLYVSRKLASKRRLTNEELVWKQLLKPAGFERVFLERMTVTDQVHLFKGAEVVIAPHGAGLTNVLFMHARSLVIELVPALRAKPEFFLLSGAMNLRYACVTNAPEGKTAQDSERIPDTDFDIPIDRLASIMAQLGLI